MLRLGLLLPDSTPNYLTTEADGTIGADFSGRVHAQGLTIDPGPDSVSIASDNSVEWRTVIGALVASIASFGNDGAGQRGMNFDVFSPVSGGESSMDFTTLKSFGGFGSSRAVTFGLDTDGVTPRIYYNARETGSVSILHTLIDSNNNSDLFATLDTPGLNAREIWGQVATTGVITRDGSQDWASVRMGVGVYDITSNRTLVSQAWIPTATPVASSGAMTTISAISGTGFTVRTFNAAGVATDIGFMFRATGRA